MGVFLTFGGRKAGAFFSFFVVTPPLRGGVGVLWFTSLLLNGSGHRRRLVRRTVERLVRIFFHAGVCRFEIVGGVCAGCWRGDGSRMEHFAIAVPRCRADRIISRRPAHAREPIGVGVLLFCSALTGLLFTSERQGSGATHGISVYLCSEEKPSPRDQLWVVAWNPLLSAHFCSVNLDTTFRINTNSPKVNPIVMV